MLQVAALIAFTAGGLLAVGIIVHMMKPQWRRIARLALGHVETPPTTERWRTVHLAADRRPPFQRSAAIPHRRRGLFGRGAK